jgi:hypothetical protein
MVMMIDQGGSQSIMMMMVVQVPTMVVQTLLRRMWTAQPEAVPATLPLAQSWHPCRHFDKRSW